MPLSCRKYERHFNLYISSSVVRMMSGLSEVIVLKLIFLYNLAIASMPFSRSGSLTAIDVLFRAKSDREIPP